MFLIHIIYFQKWQCTSARNITTLSHASRFCSVNCKKDRLIIRRDASSAQYPWNDEAPPDIKGFTLSFRRSRIARAAIARDVAACVGVGPPVENGDLSVNFLSD